MRRSSLKLAALVVLIALAEGSAVAEKSTVDPNASPKVEVEANKPDSRLALKVTYGAKHKPVRTILADLSKLMGVTLKAGTNDKDWQVRDRRMNVFAKDTPLQDLMDSIARVMKFSWASGGKGDTRTYRLFTDKKTMLEVESKRLAAEERWDKELADKRSDALDFLLRTDAPSEAELSKLKADDPYDYYLITTGIASAMGSFLRETPTLKDALASGQQLLIASSSLSAAGRESLLNAVNAASTDSHGQLLAPEFAENIGSAIIVVNENPDCLRQDSLLVGMLGNIELYCANSKNSYRLPFLDSSSARARFSFKAVVDAREGRPTAPENRSDGLMEAILSDIGQHDDVDTTAKHPLDPALDVKIKLIIQKDGTSLADFERSLHDASEFAVVSDSFGSSGPGADWPSDKEITVRDALDKIERGYRYNWDRHASVLEFCDKNWYRKRAAQIPDEQLDVWQKTFEQTGTLDIDDLCDIAALSTDQLGQGFPSDVMPGVSTLAVTERPLLRFYGSLSGTQRAAILSNQGLNLAKLTADQWRQAQWLIVHRSIGLSRDRQSDLTLTATKSKIGQFYEYKFVVLTSQSEGRTEWRFATPKYREPEKDKPAKQQADRPKEVAPVK